MRSTRAIAVSIAFAAILASLAPSASCSDAAGEESDDAALDRVETPPPPTDAGIDAATPLVNTCRGVPDGGALDDVWLADPKLCLTVYAANLLNPRMLTFAPNGDLFVLQNTLIDWLSDANGDGVVDETPAERGLYGSSFPDEPPFTHGLSFSPDGKYLYVSNMSAVYRWPYTSGDRVAPKDPEIVISNIPGGGAHDSRTIVFDAAGRLVFHVGSLAENDFDAQTMATRSMVKRFTIPTVIPPGGIDYATGEIVASGLRNEVGLAIDRNGRVWGVENGADFLGEDNPAEELNLLEPSPTHFFGSPICYSEGVMEGGLGPGTQWLLAGGGNPYDDSTWCRAPKNVQPPAGVMPAHWAPLGVVAYAGGSLPYADDLIITSHGSTFRAMPNGRVLARARLSGGKVVSIGPIVGHRGADGGLEEGTWDARPVGITIGPEGAVYFTENFGHRVLRLGYAP